MGAPFPKWLLFGSWASIVLWLSLTPRPPHISQGLLGWDKFQHAVAYVVLTALAGTVFKSAPLRTLARHPWPAAFWFALVFGALMELLQALMALGRAAEIADLIADAIGAGAVYLIARYYGRHQDRNRL